MVYCCYGHKPNILDCLYYYCYYFRSNRGGCILGWLFQCFMNNMKDIRKRFKYVITFVVIVLCIIIYYFVDPTKYSIMPKCPVKMITTLDCPGCGFQRALHALLHGHYSEAIHYNQFLLLAIPITILWWVINKVIYHSKRHNMRTRLICINRYIIYFYVCCYFVWFAIRNIY